MSSSNNTANPPIPVIPDPAASLSSASTIQPGSPSSTTQSPGSEGAFFPKFIKILQKASKKLFIWFVFTVVVGLLPIVASWFLGHFDRKLADPIDLFVHGELLIISFALAADAMGDLFNSNKLGGIAGVFLFGICFVLFALSGLIFAGLGIIGTAIDKQGVSTFSFYMLAATFLASMGCKILTEV